MTDFHIAKSTKTVLVLGHQSAGQSTVYGYVDNQDWNGVGYFSIFGTITAGATCYVFAQQSDDAGVSDAWENIADSKITVADTDDNKVVELDLHNAAKRYIRIGIVRADQNVEVLGVLALHYDGIYSPGTDSSDVADSTLLVNPVAGDIA